MAISEYVKRYFSEQTKGYLWIVLAAFFWSLLGVVSKFCLDAGLSPLETAFWRAVFGGGLFLLYAFVHDGFSVRYRDILVFLVFGIWGVGVFFSSLQYAIELSGAAMAVILLYTAPVWVAVFSRVLFHEQLSRRKLMAIVVALIGTGLVCFSGGSLPGSVSIVGIGAGLLTGLCYATHYPFYRWWQKRYTTAMIYGFMLAGGAITLGFFVFAQKSGTFLGATPIQFDYALDTWFWLMMLGVVSTFFAYACYGQGLKRISLVRAAVICHLEPVLGTLWVWLVWDETFSAVGWFGSILVLAAVLLMSSDKTKDQ